MRTVAGVSATNPARSIVDALDAGTQPEQIERAIHQALQRGLATPRRLRTEASARSARVRRLIDATLAEVPA